MITTQSTSFRKILLFLCVLCFALIAKTRIENDKADKFDPGEYARIVYRWRNLRTTNVRASDTRIENDVEDVEERDDRMDVRRRNNLYVDSIPKFIVNGEESERDRYPYLVSVLRAETSFFFFTEMYHMCGASLIAPDVVLCAAHCIYEGQAKYVQIGEHDFSSSIEPVETFKISEYALHPDWNPKTYDHDIAILKLPGKSSRKPVRLIKPTDELVTDETLTVMGWGSTSYQGERSEVLLEVDVNFMSHGECRKRYGSMITDNMMCAIGKGEDACQGDSGGPLIRKDPDGNPAGDVQVAVVSWGYQCAHLYYPGVYARLNIPEKRSFINKMVCEYSPENCERPTPAPTYVWVPGDPTNCQPDEEGLFMAPGDVWKRSCKWVRMRMHRCERYSSFCPASCCRGKCDSNTGLCTLYSGIILK